MLQIVNRSKAMEISAVLSDQYLASEIGKMTVCVLQIDDKKQISKLVQQLSRSHPWTESLSHLKRVRTVKRDNVLKYQIIITKALDVDKVRSEFNDLGEIIVVSVPEKCPLTRIQFDNCKNFWPTNFHENKQYVIRGKCFDEESHRIISNNFDKLVSFSLQMKKCNAALAVNNDELIELATNENSQPLKHAIICLIDRVAKKHLDVDGNEIFGIIEKSYLLTGCDVFVTEEPCVMCTMALIHSRLRRLFFIENSKKCTDLSNCPPDYAISIAKLHVNNKLNHHFEAWKVRFNK